VRIAFNGFKSGRRLDQLLAIPEERESRHAEDICRTAAEKDAFRFHTVLISNSLRQRLVQQRMAIHSTDGRLYGPEDLPGWTVRIFVAV
jgi:hypothetical protein